MPFTQELRKCWAHPQGPVPYPFLRGPSMYTANVMMQTNLYICWNLCADTIFMFDNFDVPGILYIVWTGTYNYVYVPVWIMWASSYISFYQNSVYPTFCRNKVLNRKTPIRSYYFDMTHLANYWGCDGSARRYMY